MRIRERGCETVCARTRLTPALALCQQAPGLEKSCMQPAHSVREKSWYKCAAVEVLVMVFCVAL